jgi:UDP-glucose 4-epimerase
LLGLAGGPAEGSLDAAKWPINGEENLERVNILVTGGLGVNGCWVTRQLLELGHRPIVYDTRADFSPLKDMADRIELVVGDVLDFPRLVKTIKDYRVERVCHLAAMYPEPADANPVRGFEVNALATVYILEAARIMGLDRVVYTSSYGALSVLGERHRYPTYAPVSEDHPAYPAHGGVYGASKVASELMGHVYKNLYDLDFVALRFAAIFGPGKGDPRHGLMGYAWSQMVDNAMLGIPTRYERGGDERQDMIYSRDVAHSVVLGCLAAKSSLKHQLFHVASGRGYTLHDFAAAVNQVFPDAQIQIGPGTNPRAGIGSLYLVFDISRAQEELGYAPRFTLPEAVADWVGWMRTLELEPRPRPTT